MSIEDLEMMKFKNIQKIIIVTAGGAQHIVKTDEAIITYPKKKKEKK